MEVNQTQAWRRRRRQHTTTMTMYYSEGVEKEKQKGIMAGNPGSLPRERTPTRSPRVVA